MESHTCVHEIRVTQQPRGKCPAQGCQRSCLFSFPRGLDASNIVQEDFQEAEIVLQFSSERLGNLFSLRILFGKQWLRSL